MIFTCSCSVKIKFLGEVLKIRKPFLYNANNVAKKRLFSVCRTSVFQLQIKTTDLSVASTGGHTT